MPKAKSKSKSKKTIARATAPTDQATMVVTLYDGTREPIESEDFLIRIFDGFQNQLFDKERPAPTTVFHLPYRDNLQDNCIVLAARGGYVDAGFSPVKLSLKAVAMVDLMLLPDKATFRFQTWEELKANDAVVSDFISVGSMGAEAQANYDDVRKSKPSALASLLNLASAMKTIHLPSGTPLDYFKEILWNESLAQDRFFGYADKSLVDQVRRAAMEGEFTSEPSPGLFHPEATSSFKQVQFGEANVQLTFHEKDTKNIGGVQCLKVEPDIDYFKDLGAHTILEVIPNSITHGLTDPKKGICAAMDCRTPRRRAGIRSSVYDCRLIQTRGNLTANEAR
jgi:hypothetical protein